MLRYTKYMELYTGIVLYINIIQYIGITLKRINKLLNYTKSIKLYRTLIKISNTSVQNILKLIKHI